ncbi:hypothetical protein DCC26_05625 [Auritidibacter sp. NML120779]|nr:hypothetical protein DCC26_05625 [Auritidibacter sp. NML120779]
MDSASRQARLMVVEDHPVVALGLINIFSDEPDLQVVAQASSSREALKMIGQENPDLVIVPMRLDGELAGLGLSQRIKERRPGTKVLIFSSYFSAEEIGLAYLSGADSYVVKYQSPQALVDTVRATLAGQRVWAEPLAGAQFTEIITDVLESAALTRRETEVLGLMVRRLGNEEIARKLVISLSTVKSHVSRVLHKLGYRDRKELMADVVVQSNRVSR